MQKDVLIGKWETSGDTPHASILPKLTVILPFTLRIITINYFLHFTYF